MWTAWNIVHNYCICTMSNAVLTKVFSTLFCPEPIGNIEFAREETPKPKSNVTAFFTRPDWMMSLLEGSIVWIECCRLASQPNQERSCHSLSISNVCSLAENLICGVPIKCVPHPAKSSSVLQLPEQFYCLTHLPVQQTQIAPAGVILGNLCKCLLLTEDHKCHPLGKTTSHTPYSL